MEFSTGQIVFALTFFVLFVAAMIWAYRKDIQSMKLHYRGVVYIFLGIIVFLLIYRLLAHYLHGH